MVFLRTERLTLRDFLPEDAERLSDLDAAPGVMEFLDGEEETSPEEYRRWIGTLDETYPPGSNRGFWAVEEDGRFIGWFHLRPAKDTGELELGYRLRPEAWGRGLATEGSRALLELAGERVIARTMMINVRSRRVMEKLGMRVVRTFPYSGEGPDDEVEYAL
ncbi:GNAT family N-acetyltransferase [soil metagenome]